MYRIGNSGDWLTYNNQPIKVNQGDTIYAKGIDKYGNETRVISSLTINVSDALTYEAYDGDETTATAAKIAYISVDPSLQGKKIRIKAKKSGSWAGKIIFYDANGASTGTAEVYQTVNLLVTVPMNTVKICFGSGSDGYYISVYEIIPIIE